MTHTDSVKTGASWKGMAAILLVAVMVAMSLSPAASAEASEESLADDAVPEVIIQDTQEPSLITNFFKGSSEVPQRNLNIVENEPSEGALIPPRLRDSENSSKPTATGSKEAGLPTNSGVIPVEPQQSGGPDMFGYVWEDSNAPAPTIPYTWVDGVTGGTALMLSDDDWAGPINMGMSFNYYGKIYDNVYIMSNGWISFVDADSWFQDVPIPDDVNYQGIISPYSCDINPGAWGEVYYQCMPGTPDMFVVTWYDIPHYSTSEYQTFQAVLYGDGDIMFNYQTMTNPWGIVGIENEISSDGLDYSSGSPPPVSGTSILFYGPPPPAYAVEINPDFESNIGLPGNTVSYDLSVTNNGINTDTFDLSAKNNEWPVEFWSSSSVSLINEQFEGAFPPPGWVTVDYFGWGYPGGEWHSNDYTGYSNDAGTGQCTEANSDYLSWDWTWSGGVDAGLCTPIFNLDGYASATLEFDQYYLDENWGSWDYAEVWICWDGGGSWDLLDYYDEDHGPNEHVTLDLTPWIGLGDAFIEFYYYDDWNWCYWWQIDNVEVTAYTETSVPITSVGPLALGDVAFFSVRVNIPADASPGEFDVADITASSRGDNTVLDTVQLCTYIPSWFDNFESGSPGWTVEGDMWHMVQDGVSPYPNSHSPTTSWWYGQDATGDYDNGNSNWGVIISPPVDLTGQSTTTLSFWEWYQTEGLYPMFDQRWVFIYSDSTGWVPVEQLNENAMNAWQQRSFDVSPFSNQIVHIAFYFDTGDEIFNGFRGWYIDDVSLGSPLVFDFTVSPDSQTNFGWVGEWVEHRVSITNTGTIPDVYLPMFYNNMDTSQNADWWTKFFTVDLRPQGIYNGIDDGSQTWWWGPVQPGETKEYAIKVFVPTNEIGAFDQARIFITSDNLGSVVKEIEIWTRLSMPAPFYDTFELAGNQGEFGLYNDPVLGWIHGAWQRTDTDDVGVWGGTSYTGTFSLYTGGEDNSATTIKIDMDMPNGIASCVVRRGDVAFGSDNPEAGEDLIIEYSDGNLQWAQWHELGRFPGGGTPGEILTPLWTLPEDALNPRFQLRFRTVNGEIWSDYWHIDNVFIGAPESWFGLQTPTTSDMRGPGDIALYEISVENYARHCDEYTVSLEGNTWPTEVLVSAFKDDFDDLNRNGWTVVDEGWTDGPPSNWYVDGAGRLRQTDNIYSYSGQWLPGTYLWNGNAAWSDYILTADLMSSDNDGIGLMARYTDSHNYYRFHWSADAGWDKDLTEPGLQRRVLDVCVDGVWQVLASDNIPYTLSQWYDVEMRMLGDRIQVLIDGNLIFDVNDGSLDHGAIALYSWGNTGIYFDNVAVFAQDTLISPLGPQGPLNTDTFFVAVDIPADVIGLSDTVTVTVTSILEPWVSNTMTLTTTAARVHNLDQDTWFMAIQPAVNAADPGDTLWAYPDTYQENVVVDKAVTIHGLDRDTTIVDGTVDATGGVPLNNILIYADDAFHPAPNTYVDQALNNLGLTYTAHYDSDFAGFEADLTGGGPWDLVIFGHENYNTDLTTILNALDTYIAGGGRVIFNTWEMSWTSHAFWTTMGVAYASDDGSPPDPVYWWDTSNPLFNSPESVPQLTTPADVGYGTYACKVNPLAGFDAIAGHVPAVTAGEAAIVPGNDGRTIFKSFLDGQFGQDADTDGIADGVELWINMISSMGTPMARTSVFDVRANYVSIDGFTIQNNDVGILLDGVAGCEIHDNIIRNCGDGIQLNNAGGNRIQGNEILNNVGAGILAAGNTFAPFQDDFAADSGLWTYYGNAARVGGYCSLTTNAGSLVGQILYNEPIHTPFIATFDFYAGGGTGADGMAFNFFKEAYTPAGGGSIGAQDADETTLGYAIEFDNWDNGASDPSANHIALIQNNVNNHLTNVNDPRTEDATWHNVMVIVTPWSVTVYVDDMDNPLLEWSGQLDMTHGGMSFSAGTGGSTNHHRVDNVRVVPLGNMIEANQVKNNDFGVILDSSMTNKVFHNNFINNGVHALDNRDDNQWDDGYPSGGNYWSGFTGPDTQNGPLQNIPGADGMIDNPYVIDASSQDNYPLKGQYTTAGIVIEPVAVVEEPVEEPEDEDEGDTITAVLPEVPTHPIQYTVPQDDEIPADEEPVAETPVPEDTEAAEPVPDQNDPVRESVASVPNGIGSGYLLALLAISVIMIGMALFIRKRK